MIILFALLEKEKKGRMRFNFICTGKNNRYFIREYQIHLKKRKEKKRILFGSLCFGISDINERGRGEEKKRVQSIYYG